MHSNTESICCRAVDNYYSMVTGAPVGSWVPALHVFASARRLSPEEGYGGAWPLFLLRRADCWWLSVAPTLLPQTMSIVEPAYSAGRFDGTLAAALRDIVASQHTVQYAGHSLLFIPTMDALAVGAPTPASDTLPDRAVVRPITPQEKPSNVPEESVEAGTAFGIFIDDILVSWAEATPLPTVTSRFGVMLVGIETSEGYRQRGFARAGLTALTARVISMGRVPLYSCAQHNVASQRTALSCGYRRYGESIRVQAAPRLQADGRQSSA